MSEYVGFDVSQEEPGFCVMDGSGKVLSSGKTLSDPHSLFEALRAHTLCPERIVLETGALLNWLARGLRLVWACVFPRVQQSWRGGFGPRLGEGPI